MKILVIGASSYVGAKIYCDLKNKFEVIGTYNSSKLFEDLKHLDLNNKNEIINFIIENKPDIIIQVAAKTNHNWCVNNPKEADMVNHLSLECLVESANQIKAKVIYISSFVVLGNDTLYAKTKLAGEDVIKKNKFGFVIIRPGHIVGYSPNTTNDRQFNRFLNNMCNNIPAVYDYSWKFQPTYLRHISEVIQKVIELNISGKIIPVVCDDLKTRFDLANDILSRFNIDVKGENKNDKSKIIVQDLSILRELNLPMYEYSEIIEEMVKEIKENHRKIINDLS